jgi:hypothetical protein
MDTLFLILWGIAIIIGIIVFAIVLRFLLVVPNQLCRIANALDDLVDLRMHENDFDLVIPEE